MRLDRIVPAFPWDRTRIVTLLRNLTVSQMNPGFLQGFCSHLHLDLTYDARNPWREAMYLKTKTSHVALFADRIGRLKAIAGSRVCGSITRC